MASTDAFMASMRQQAAESLLSQTNIITYVVGALSVAVSVFLYFKTSQRNPALPGFRG